MFDDLAVESFSQQVSLPVNMTLDESSPDERFVICRRAHKGYLNLRFNVCMIPAV